MRRGEKTVIGDSPFDYFKVHLQFQIHWFASDAVLFHFSELSRSLSCILAAKMHDDDLGGSFREDAVEPMDFEVHGWQ